MTSIYLRPVIPFSEHHPQRPLPHERARADAQKSTVISREIQVVVSFLPIKKKKKKKEVLE